MTSSPLLEVAIRSLKSVGLIVEDLSNTAEPDSAADMMLRVTTPTGATQLYEVHTASRVLAANERGKTLMAAEYVPESTADAWRRQDIHYIDAAGNMYLRLEGLLADVRGRKALAPSRSARTGKSLRMFGSSGLKILFILLAEPSMAAAPYREIAHASNSSLGTVQWVFKELEESGYLASGPRRRVLIRTGNLFNRWVDAYVLNLSPTLTVACYDAPNPAWWSHADLNPDEAQWGGETAAYFLTQRLRPGRAVLYAPKVPSHLAATNRFRKARDEGNVEIRARFWPVGNSPSITVPAPLVYADLIASDDPRQREVANYLREHDEHLRRLDRG